MHLAVEGPSRGDDTYCVCGQAKLAKVAEPVPGVHYCVFGACKASVNEAPNAQDVSQ